MFSVFLLTIVLFQTHYHIIDKLFNKSSKQTHNNLPRGVKNPLTELFDRHTSDRTKLIMLLGNKCKNPECLVPGGCTDIRCLQLDHINGGGVRQMKYLKGCNNMYRYYLKHIVEACNDLQVLCANCNWTKRYGNRHEYGGTKSMFLT